MAESLEARMCRVEADMNDWREFIRTFNLTTNAERMEKVMEHVDKLRQAVSAVESNVVSLERGEPLVAPGMFVAKEDFDAYQRVVAGFLKEGYLVKLCRTT